ncbi:MAG: hypothetical protein J4215_05585 [Candidatus Diapherotrites archaeon]|uniref:Uncharacterized protein n=1 Tax=Candidatus Iainarchaeum sp. TaxID=3101447 RepID=A0A8T4LGK0_9ARCH|nr:hypothetical protein [Candidatus Diapherotrites archaeon]
MLESAKKHEPVFQNKPSSQQKIIGADEAEGPSIPLQLLNDPTLWTKCGHLKRSGERCFCTQYIALCAQEKCPSKVMKIQL